MDSLTSPNQTESKQADPTADANDGENADNDMQEEASPSEGSPAQTSVSEQDQKNPDTVQGEDEKEEDDDSIIDCDASTTSPVSNRFTVLSEEQHSKDSVIDDDKTSDMDQEEEEDTQLVSDMEKVTLDDAFIEDSEDATEQVMESEDEPLEAKEYTVVNEDPELAFHTMATRTAPEKQECSVQSCLFQFTEVETLTQNNSLLCVTCTKQQPKDKAGGMRNFSP